MKSYLNRRGNSGIVAYDYDNEKFIVKFDDGWVYEYPISIIGETNFRQMIVLSSKGEGLNAFIMRNRTVRTGFSRKYQLS